MLSLHAKRQPQLQGRKPVISIGGDLNSGSAEKIFLRPPQHLNLGGDELSSAIQCCHYGGLKNL